MLIFFSGLLVLITVLYFISAGKYADYVAPLDKRVYKLKKAIPVGLYLLDTFKHRYTTTYDRKLLMALTEVSGPGNSLYYLKIHWGNKITLILAGVLFIALIGTASEIDAGYIFFSVLMLGGIAYFNDRELFESVKRRRMLIRLEFPDFINKLMLLINAGMTVNKAWERVTLDSKKLTPLYNELNITLQDIKAGKPEQRAYEDFAKRCRIPEITRFISVILQNLRKGNSELVPILRVIGNECWEMRKNTAKKYGEEASTKMLLPMMIMFLAILLIVGTPAVLSLRGI